MLLGVPFKARSGSVDGFRCMSKGLEIGDWRLKIGDWRLGFKVYGSGLRVQG